MKISIITVTFNSAATIEHTIRSVAAQDYPGKEHIIIDGGSTDGTLDIISRFRVHISKLVTEKDEGLYFALNKGISIAEGNVIGILHSDDFFVSNDVISSYARLFEDPACDAAYSDLFYVDRDNTDKITRRWRSGAYKPGSFIYGWMPPHPTFFVRSDLYRKYGTFDTRLKSSADYELMLRFIHRHGVKPCYLPQFTVKMRTGGKSNVSIGNRVRANKEDRQAWLLNGLKPKFFTLYFKPLRKLFQFLR